ncbi:MAG: 50S ribosomal protein L23 [Dehalococcoidia bacterium]|nr:50S ribosomal protein L23 [Dehalococcoidia bacterium]
MHVFEVLRRPIVTEKTTAMQTQNKYTFEVAKGANKVQIREAVEKAFSVNVITVAVSRVPGKTRRVGKRQVLTSAWRKGIVTLKPGQKIELFEGV